MRKLVFSFIAITLFLLLTISIGEAIFMLFVVNKGQKVEIIDNKSYFVHQTKVKISPWINTILKNTKDGFRFNPSVKGIIKNSLLSQKDVLIETNSLGLRDSEIPEEKGKEFRILFLGDSITAAAYENVEDTFVRITENILKGKGRDVRAINAGVGSLNLHEEIALLKEVGLGVKPDLLILGLYLNDHAERGPAFRMPWIFYKSYFLSWLHNRAYLASKLFYNYHKGYNDWGKKFAGGRELKAGDWRKDKDAYDYEIVKVAFDWGYSWDPEAWEILRPDFEELIRLGKEHRFKIGVVLFPVVYQIYTNHPDVPQQHFRSLMGELDLKYLDMLGILRKEVSKESRPLYYDQCHFNAETNRIVAENIAGFLLSNYSF